jgi:hypothetical protein
MSDFLLILSRPENLWFLVPAIVAILFMLLQIVGFGADSLSGKAEGLDAGHDHDVGHDHDHDVGHDHDHDVGHDHDHDHDHDADHDHDHHHEVAHGHAHDHHHVEPAQQGLVSAVLTWFNVGRAPFMIVVETLLLSFGAFGIAGTTILGRYQGIHGREAVLMTLPAALVLGALTAKFVSGFFARHLPTFESKRVTSRALVGLTAEVASEEVTTEGGRASAKDPQGDQFTVFCRLPAGMAAVKRGEKVMIVEYDPREDRYTVKPVAAGAAPGASAPTA